VSKKGPAYEREVCRDLSDWFSYGKHDDWFWRSSQSGGRATTRSKKGKTTAGHYGDITATCPQGARLLNVIAIEIKRGYAKDTIADLLDRANGSAQQKFEGMLQQAWSAHVRSGSYSWMLIVRRDRRQAICYFPKRLERKLKRLGAFRHRPFARMSLRTTLRFTGCDNKGMKKKKGVVYVTETIVAIDLQEWLDEVTPSSVRELAKQLKGN
jgi:hypothetical protein